MPGVGGSAAWSAVLPRPAPDATRSWPGPHEAGLEAQQEVAAQLRALVAADVDAQRTTPLAVVRAAVVRTRPRCSTRPGVPPVPRDPFVSERFPDDPYGLTPASLAALDPELGELAIAWGAAKAMAHRRRHQEPPEFT